MSLVVEDGTGKANAESYQSVAGLRAYADARGLTIADDDQVLEQKLREATEYVDTCQRYKAQRSSATQAREFPRTGLLDWSSMPVEGVPKRVVDATNYLAVVAHGESLWTDSDRGGVRSESVGPISTTYDGSPVNKVFTTAMKLLEQYVRDPSEPLPVIGFATPASGVIFSVGMDDYPGSSSPLISPEE
jgi:hypothetical protein